MWVFVPVKSRSMVTFGSVPTSNASPFIVSTTASISTVGLKSGQLMTLLPSSAIDSALSPGVPEAPLGIEGQIVDVGVTQLSSAPVARSSMSEQPYPPVMLSLP